MWSSRKTLRSQVIRPKVTRFVKCRGFVLNLLIGASIQDGKIRPSDLDSLYPDGDFHHVQPKLLSITQCTEYGTTYSISEVQALATAAHKSGMFLHMDGARLYNAAVHLGCSLREITADCGVDARDPNRAALFLASFVLTPFYFRFCLLEEPRMDVWELKRSSLSDLSWQKTFASCKSRRCRRPAR